MNQKPVKIWTYQKKIAEKIESLENELERWKNDDKYWCNMFGKVVLKSDGCNRHSMRRGDPVVKGDILCGSCRSCEHRGDKVG
jgi:hypothetical protein